LCFKHRDPKKSALIYLFSHCTCSFAFTCNRFNGTPAQFLHALTTNSFSRTQITFLPESHSSLAAHASCRATSTVTAHRCGPFRRRAEAEHSPNEEARPGPAGPSPPTTAPARPGQRPQSRRRYGKRRRRPRRSPPVWRSTPALNPAGCDPPPPSCGEAAQRGPTHLRVPVGGRAAPGPARRYHLLRLRLGTAPQRPARQRATPPRHVGVAAPPGGAEEPRP